MDGEWLEWGGWSPCLGRCGEASRSRGRACTAPAFDGRPCRGEDMETEEGSMNCPGVAVFFILILHPLLTSEWTEWAPWSSCSQSCGGGSRTRERNCTSSQDGSALPSLAADSRLFGLPSNFQACPGEPEEMEPCGEESCPGEAGEISKIN